MEKTIVIAGSPNSGKTLSVNMAIRKLFESGAVFEKCLFGSNPEFWNSKGGGAVILTYNDKRIALISYGDTVGAVEEVLNSEDVLSCDIIVCCSHATRGKKVFEYFHEYIKNNIIFSSTKLIPIYKNLLCRYGKPDLENAITADLIIDLI